MDTELLIKKETRQELLQDVYLQSFPAVAAHIARAGGSLDDAKDIFHDALILYYEKVDMDEILSHQAYLLGIVKNLWRRRVTEMSRLTDMVEVTEGMDQEQMTWRLEKLLAFVKSAGERCVDLLTSFYYNNASMRDIATKFGFSGERSATAQKFKCLEKVRNSVKEKSLSYEDFIE